MYAVEVKDLVKYYGSFMALKGITFHVDEGDIYGLIGPNGAGKSTTLRILATLLKPSSGVARIFGYDVDKDADRVRRIISYLPEEAGGYKYLTGFEYLSMNAKMYDPENFREYVEYGIEISGLGDRIYDRIGSYSKGMIRRLLLARALMMKPRLAILDEPTAGMDVVHATVIRDIIKNVAREDVTILLSSHNMLEVHYLCNKISLINEGRIVASGSPSEIIDSVNASNLEEAFVRLVRG
ncbi:multidrug ABC transporter ATP-binding protein [Candidatus Geothermarchaeota archaeon]|nr:MAG: multidrug ABC transporter ATP-binding protein [Candidatus Geothermarchaeota archaeon]RLG62678.1 MAG: multidrug ABC transporter ATP-binding protein [Candidatus Geothermarchaeota archaeon]HEW93535.1 ABC transporter ATP-binding protein [Thermoprotei archaeon]